MREISFAKTCLIESQICRIDLLYLKTTFYKKEKRLIHRTQHIYSS